VILTGDPLHDQHQFGVWYAQAGMMPEGLLESRRHESQHNAHERNIIAAMTTDQETMLRAATQGGKMGSTN